MGTNRVERRLAAIVAADVAGYSRLMGLDEVGTARTLREHRAASDVLVGKHGGRIVKTTGDGLLLEFPSVVDAVECAAAVQALMAERNDGVPQDRRMLYRIGINLGDILIDGDDILGDGVNVAARLEGIAEPGGICISSSAYDQVHGKVGVEFVDLGEQTLKNIYRPVRAYAVAQHALGSKTPPGVAPGPVSVPRLSIMVLPFANIGGDREQEYFVDGITESLTTDLSQIPDSFVIARNTAFTYKDKPVDVKQIGRELGIAYVVEGSVQRAAKKIRVNVQLIDTSTGSHLWAERFDRDHSELFQMQDEIIARLARTLDIELVAAVVQSEAKFHSENPSSVDYTFRGRAAMNRGLTFEFQNEASRNFEQAIAIDPNNAAAWAGLAFAQGNIVGNFMTDDRAAHLRTAENAALRALKLAPNNPRGHAALGNVYRSSNRPIEAIGEFELALELDPNLLQAYPLLGIAKIGAGRAEETEGHITDAIRISPKDRSMHGFCLVAGAGNLFATRDEEAVLWLLRSIKANQEYPLPHFYLAIAFALQNKLLEARDEIRAGLALDPCFSLRRYQGSAYSDNPR